MKAAQIVHPLIVTELSDSSSQGLTKTENRGRFRHYSLQTVPDLFTGRPFGAARPHFPLLCLEPPSISISPWISVRGDFAS